MSKWIDEIRNSQEKQAFDLEKAFTPELITIEEFYEFFNKGGYEIVDENLIEKSAKDTSKLVKKEVWVNRNGKFFKQTVWINPVTNEEQETQVGQEISPTVKGLQIEKYSDKTILIKGDTYANIDLMRGIKSQTGFGTWSGKNKGWIFALNQLDKILGLIWSDIKDKDEDKAAAIQNQKNESLEKGDELAIGGEKGKVEQGASDNEGVKYDVTLNDGTELKGVDEKVIDVAPIVDDEKIAEIVNNAQPENRAKVEKQLFGIKAVEDIHKYSLQDYMRMHGLSDEDIQNALKRIKERKEEGKKRTSGGGGTKSEKGQKEGLTKNQLIGKLIAAHYQAVKSAIEKGEEIPESALEYYDDLKAAYNEKRKAMSEETKRKISEALKKNKIEMKEAQKPKDKEKAIIDKNNYQPKEGETFKVLSTPNMANKMEVEIKTKDYTDVPAMDVKIPKQKDILKQPRPYFIPEIDETRFANNGYTISAIKMGDDKYLVALDSFTKRSATFSFESIEKDKNFAVMSLDAYAATQKYYQLKAKEELKQKELDSYNKKVDNLKKALAEAKEKGNTELIKNLEYNLSYYENKKPRMSRLTMYDKENKMSVDQSRMIKAFVRNEDGSFIGDRKVWEVYKELFGFRKQKQIDIDMQAEHDASSFVKGRETSFGESGTKDTLFNDYGVKVKRQNGDEINEQEILEIKEALDNAIKIFGNNINMNKEFGLKISHSGNVKMHASTATGIFFPHYGTIGISKEKGEDMFKFVFGHEYAHFIDYWVGKKTGNYFASDKQGSTANKIASIFRSNMNKKSDSDYTNRTCECLARALEQYVAIETKGESAIVWNRSEYFKTDDYVNKDIYEKELKPLIKQFLEENKDILKSFPIDLFA